MLLDDEKLTSEEKSSLVLEDIALAIEILSRDADSNLIRLEKKFRDIHKLTCDVLVRVTNYKEVIDKPSKF